MIKLKYIVLFVILLTFNNLTAQEGNLVINEILAANQNDIQDDFLDHDDWLEIYYQAGSSPAVINLAGYYLSDNPNNLTKWRIPDTNGGLTTIVSGQHLLFWIDKDPEQGEDHVDFKFSANGESIILSNPDTVIIDSVTFPEQVADISYGRSCDGCEDFVFFNNTTPDDTNQEIVPEQQLLFINEIMTDNIDYVDDPANDFEPWIEIYNPNAFQVNLAGYKISNTSNPDLYTFETTNPQLTVIPENGYLLIWCDNELFEGENHTPLALENTGTITLTGIDGLVDSYTYEAVASNHSWGRQVDGSLNSIEFSIPTPRVTNSLVISPPEPLFINELLAANTFDVTDNFDEYEDWIEIYNPNNYPVNLAGYYLSDNPENPMKFQIPIDQQDSTTIAAESWMLFWADEDTEQGINHLNFRLSNNGEEVTLYSPDGFSQADHIEFIGELADISSGRETDGNSNWVHFSETTPNASNNGADIVLSIESNQQKEMFKLWPNPTQGGVIYFSEKLTFSLHDSQGSLIHFNRTDNQLDVSDLSTGLYLISTIEYGTVKMIVK